HAALFAEGGVRLVQRIAQRGGGKHRDLLLRRRGRGEERSKYDRQDKTHGGSKRALARRGFTFHLQKSADAGTAVPSAAARARCAARPGRRIASRATDCHRLPVAAKCAKTDNK